jgi:hypothetical protein
MKQHEQKKTDIKQERKEGEKQRVIKKPNQKKGEKTIKH